MIEKIPGGLVSLLPEAAVVTFEAEEEEDAVGEDVEVHTAEKAADDPGKILVQMGTITKCLPMLGQTPLVFRKAKSTA